MAAPPAHSLPPHATGPSPSPRVDEDDQAGLRESQRPSGRDIAIAAGGIVASLAVLLAVNGFEALSVFLQHHEPFQLDELLITLLVAACAVAWVARRGQRRLARAIAARDNILRRYRALVDHSLDGVFVVAADSTIIAVNPTACRILGYRSDELVGQRVAMIDPEFSTPDEAVLARQLRGGHPVTVERRHRRKDGSIVPVSVRIVSATHNGLPCTVAVARDLTEPLQLESALQSTSTWLTLAAEGTLTGLWSWDIVSDVTRYSPSWRQQLGYDDASFDGSWTAWAAILHPDDAEPLSVALRELMQGIRERYELEIRVRHRDGDYRWLLSRAAVVRDKAGTLTQIVGTHTDITRQKRAEEEIRQLNAQLMTDARALAQTNADLEAFGYSVWHDLRAPLRRVSGFARILLEDHARELSADGRSVLDRIASGTLRMGELIDDLFRLSQIGHADMHVEPVDLSAMARLAAEQLAQHYGDRAVEVSIAPQLSVTADRQLMRILLENVLDNAFKYTRTTPGARISVGINHTEADPVFFVRDNGVGFDVANAQRLFAPFQRFHANEEFPGNGVGLAIVERIVRLHAGRVWVDSQPGQGTTLSFTVGAAPPPPPAPRSALGRQP